MKNRNKWLMYGFGMMAASLWITNTAFAETAENSAMEQYALDDVIVTATRTEKTVLDTPANARIITAAQIKQGGYMSVFEAIKNLAQADVSAYQEDGGDWGTSGMSSRIKLRGLDSGTLILVNGNPCNYMNYGTVNNIPMDQIERIEIVKGAGSVLYGPQAMGGVINIITKKPGKNGKVSGSVYGTAGNQLQEAGMNVYTDTFNVGMKKSFSKDRGNLEEMYPSGNGPAINLKNKKSDQMYLDIQLTKDLTFSYGRTNNKALFDASTFKNYARISHYADNIDTTFNNYAVVYDVKASGLKIVAGYNTIDSSSIYDKTLPTVYSDNTFTGYDANLDVQKKLKLRNNQDSLILGANLTAEHMKYTYSKYGGSNNRNAYSLYQSYDYQANKKWDFIFGIREYYVARSKYQNKDFQLLPQIQGCYKINDQASYYFNIGKSFEMPQIGSGFYYGGSGFVVNPNLKPQSSWSYELGYKFDDKRRSFSSDVFYLDVKDKFVSALTSTGESTTINRDQWKNVGLELNYQQKLNPVWTVSGGFTLQNPRSKTGSSAWVQDNDAKYILNIGAAYTKAKFTADARVFSYFSRQAAYYNYQGGTKTADHKLADSCDVTLTLTYQPTAVDSFKLIGRNLLNRKDVINNYEYYSAPMNFTFTYERSF